jgi:hypothetical protein
VSRIIDALIGELVAFISPISQTLQSDHGVSRLLEQLGVPSTGDNPLEPTLSDTVPAASEPALINALKGIVALETQLRALLPPEDADPATLAPLSFDALTQALSLARQAVAIVGSLPSAVSALGGFPGIGEDFLKLLVTAWLSDNHALFRHAAIVLGLIESVEERAPAGYLFANGAITRIPFRIDSYNFSKLGDLLRDPLAALKLEYANAFATEADADAIAKKLWPRLHDLLFDLGIATAVGVSDFNLPDLGAAGPIMQRSMIVHTDDQLAGADAEAGLVFSLSPASQGDLGVVVTPFGELTFTRSVGNWQISASVSADVDAVAWGRQGITVASGAAASEFKASFGASLPKAADGTPAFLLGSSTGTRLEIGSLEFGLAADLSTSARSLALSANFKELNVVIAPGDSDGFLSSILPADGLHAKADVGIAWSNATGLTLSGSGSLDTRLPIGLSIGGVSIPNLHVALSPANGSVSAELSAQLSASIGPVKATIDGVGVSGTLSFPNSGGALGFADLALGLKGPSGIALSVDAEGIVSGAGFLFHDPAQGSYVGGLQLTLHETLTLTALGLVATRMPDGSRGYSLLIFITAENFKPIPLGLGFTLTAIGGLVAINRTFDETVIRDGLKNDTLKTLLFPKDPVTNATAIVRSLQSAFPARSGSYLLGLMARICWGTPTIIQFDLALILEIGARERLIALGRVTATLPKPDSTLIRLKLDALGVLDFDAGTIALDAILVDSRIASKFAITGAAALRAGWGKGPGNAFVLAVGGFNPRFAPPAGVPQLPRVAIALSTGDNPRLSCEAYIAITSNTVQFGARAQLYASAIGFALVGDVGFDVLFDSPVHFIADFHASVQLKHGSTNLFKVSVAGSLEGVMPLRLSGKASFEILWCDFTVRFHATLVDGPAPVVAGVDVVPQLIAALSNVGNWSTKAPAGVTHGVALRKVGATNAAGVLMLDPLGRLAVSQPIVPLATGRDVELFNGAPVTGARRFSVTASLTGSASTRATATDIEPEMGDFAPGQFFNMPEDEKLASPSFVQYQSGLLIGSDAVLINDAQLVAAPLAYDTLIIDAMPASIQSLTGRAIDVPVSATPAAAPYVMPASQLAVHAATGAAARAPVRRVGRAKFRLNADPQVELAAPSWALVNAATGAPVPVADDVTTWPDYHAVATAMSRSGGSFDVVAA